MSTLKSQLKAISTLHGQLEIEAAQIALLLLARKAREKYPNAVAIHMQETDQNDSGELWVQELYDAKGMIIPGSDTFDSASSTDPIAYHLHDGNEVVWKEFDATTLKIDGRYVLDIDRILAEVTAPPGTFRMLDASTLHLPEKVRESLNQYPGVIANDREYGWLLWVPENIDEHVAEYTDSDPGFGIPAAVIALWRCAQEHDCQYVMLDTDALAVGGLPIFED